MLVFINENFKGKRYAYHASKDKFEIGDIIGNDKHVKSFMKHDYRSLKKTVEEILEISRLENFSNKPSRLKGLFSSPYKNNRFSDIGYLYKVELIGNFHYGNSMLIDRLVELTPTGFKANELYGGNIKEISDQYWKGKLNDKKDIEILSDKIKIVEIIEKELNLDDNIILIKDCEAVIVFPRVSAKFKEVIARKHNIKIIADAETPLTKVIVPKGTIINITYSPRKQRGKYYKITGEIPNEDKFEISFKDNNLEDYYKVYNS